MIVNIRISILKTAFWVSSWWPCASSTARRGRQGALRARGAGFPETHTSGLGRTHPVTSVRFEQEKLSSPTVQRRNQRPGRSFPGFRGRFFTLFSPPQLREPRASGPRFKRDFFSVKRSEERRRARRMSTSEEADGLRPRYGCKLPLPPAHLEAAAGAAAPHLQPTFGVPRLPLSTFLTPRQRGCSLIMTSAFYNMAEREEGGPRVDSTQLFPLWMKQAGVER